MNCVIVPICVVGIIFGTALFMFGRDLIPVERNRERRMKPDIEMPKHEDPEDPSTWNLPPLDRDNPKWIKAGRKWAELNMKKDGRQPLKIKPTHRITSHYHGNSFNIGEGVFVVQKWDHPSHKCCTKTYVMENELGMRFNVGDHEIEKL